MTTPLRLLFCGPNNFLSENTLKGSLTTLLSLNPVTHVRFPDNKGLFSELIVIGESFVLQNGLDDNSLLKQLKTANLDSPWAYIQEGL